jgi:hypothetical protein
MYRTFTILILLVFLNGCSVARVQTTSGQSYLAQYEADVATVRRNGTQQKSKSGTSVALDRKIRNAASIEPILTFPARIGLARMEDGSLTDIPVDEAVGWEKFSEGHTELGQFINVNVLGTLGVSPRWSSNYYHASHTVETIRLAAARQHLDAVLIYEIGVRSKTNNTVLAVVDLTLIGGAILPTRSITAKSNARALLVDVRNGYPYGAASSAIELSQLSPSWGSDVNSDKLRTRALDQAYRELAPKIETMFEKLFAEMKTRSKKRR